MPNFQLKALAAIIGTSLISSSAYAAAFQLYELGTPLIGTADVGQATVSDASTSYFNPAGMARLDSTQYMLGSQVVVPFVNFAKKHEIPYWVTMAAMLVHLSRDWISFMYIT